MSESHSMKDYVELKVQQIKNDYLNNYERVIADYEREVAERQSYHGRELLELLQNADDEMRGESNPKAKISFDGKTLIVSNNGHPFHEKGVSSLMLSNLSPKRKDRQLIGNKGTGFRSILSWAESIRIDSGDLHISFSPKHSQQMLYNLFNGEFPEEMTAATLAFPKWVEGSKTQEYTTTIAIKIKNDSTVQNDIENQIGKLNPEILIFLNNIRELEIVSTKKKTRYLRSFKGEDVILDTYSGSDLINHQEWCMFRSDDNHYGDKLFSVVIAYNKDGIAPQNNVLHAYFPTKVEFPFPVLLHADFELDAHRNQLKEDPANDCILKRAAELLVEFAIKLYSNKDVSFDSIKFLIPTDSYSKDLKDHGFEPSLIDAVKHACIFPTVNNQYVAYSEDLKFYSGPLAAYVYGEHFADLLKYSDSSELDEFLTPIFANNSGYKHNELVAGVNAWVKLLPQNEESLKEIINFLDDILYDDDLKNHFRSYYKDDDPEKNFRLFFDKNYKLLEYSEPKFITGKTDVIKDIPSFIHYNSLHPVMEECINESESILKYLEDLNIVEYKFVDIIESANNTIDDTENTDLQKSYCIELLQWTYVYSEYINSEDKISIYAPDRNWKIKKTSQLFFGKEYGNIIGERIVNSYKTDCFIVDICELIGATREETIAFLKKLGVSKFPPIKRKYLYYSKYFEHERTRLKIYVKRILQSIKYPLIVEGDKFYSAEEFFKEIKDVNLYVNSIDDIEDILTFAETKDIIAWIKDDSGLRDVLYSSKELSTNTIRLRWKSQKADRTLECTVPSYLGFVFAQEPWVQVGGRKYRIDACLLSSEKRNLVFDSLAFPNVGEYVSDLGGKISKHKDEYTSVLKNLGMKSSFSDLPVEKIYEVLAELPNIPNSGTIAKNFYEAILEENSRKRILEDISLNNPKEYSSFMKKGKVFCRNGKYINVADASYISKKDVCESILDTVNILNVPRRVSYKFIPQLFGVKELRIQGMKLIKYEIHPNSEDFLKDFNKYKVLAFTYRVDAKQDPKPQARLFSRLEIVLCSSIQIEYKNHSYDLIDGEYYHEHGDKYYLCCSNYNKNAHRVIIGSGIASIICAHLDTVENRTDFRELYIAGTQTDRLAILHDSFDDETIQKARQLMNSDEDIRDEFINAIDQLSSKELSTYKRIIDSIDFEDITSQYNSSKIISLFKKLEIDVEEFNKKADFDITLIPYYKKEIERITPKFLVPYMNSWYYRLQDDSLEHKEHLQSEFLRYDDLCKDIKIRNSVYYTPEKEIVEQLSINVKCPSIDLVNIFRENKKSLVEQLGDDLYLDDFLSKSANASLLYYAEFDELCKRYAAFIEDNNNTDKESTDNETEQKRTVKYVNVTSSPKTTKPLSKSSSNQKHSYASTGYRDNKKNTTRIGKVGEELVYDDLLSDPQKTFVRWVSENAQKAGVNPEGSASLGYDMEYVDENGKRCYVEVKSTNGTLADGISFHLSAFEYQFAIDNSEAYYIYYVTEVDSAPKISILFDVFKDSEFNSENYSYMVGEFIVTADIVHSENAD